MTPEEKFNQEVWWVLQKIKGQILATVTGKPIRYEVVKLIASGIPSQTQQKDIIHKLQEWEAVKIVYETDPSGGGVSRYLFDLKILDLKFDQVYKKYQKACDLTSYLNDYQERMLKGDNLPEFSQIERIDNKEKATPATPIKHKGQMFETGSGGGYYNRSHPIRPMKKQSASEIVDEFSPENYPFVLMVLKKVASLTEFSTDNEVYYKLQSPFGQAIMQERSLLKKFEARGLFKHLGEDGVFGIATLSSVDTEKIKQIITEINKRQSNLQTKSEGKSVDLKVRYDQLLEEIRKPKQTSSDLSNLEERYQKTINEIKGQGKSLLVSNQTDTQVETDFTDTASRKGYEKKWDVLQAIWDVYESHSRPDSILVPVARLTIKGRDVQLIDGIVGGLKKEGLFQKWDRKDRWYNLEFINHEMLPKTYQEVGNTYKKFATAYQEGENNDTTTDWQKQGKSAPLSKRELRKKISNIIKTGKFGKKEKALLKYLAKDFEPKTIEEISKEVATKACTKLKAGVQKKLKGTGFNIKTDKGGWGREATYQLEYLLSSENS